MTKGSKGYGKSAPKTVATTVHVSSLPVKTTVSFKGANGCGGAKRSYENTSRISYGNKQSGCYGRETAKEKTSVGQFHWKNGTTGTRSEYKQSSTARFGDKSGYTELYREERVRNVSYDKGNCSSKKCITYGSKGGGSYGGSGYDDEDDGSDSASGCDSDEDDSDSGSGNDNDDNGSDGGSSSENDDDGSDGRSDDDDDDDSDGSDGYDSDN